MTSNEQPADPVVIAVYDGLIKPTIDQFCTVRPDAAPEEIAAVTHNAMLMGTGLIRVFRITAGLDRVESVTGPPEMPTFEYERTEADTPDKGTQIAAWVAAYLQGGRVGTPLPTALPEEPAPTPAPTEPASVTAVPLASSRWHFGGVYL